MGLWVDPWALLEEIKEINSKGIDISPKNLIISDTANFVFYLFIKSLKYPIIT